MVVNSSQEEGGEAGVWLRVRILKSLVLSLSTTVRAMRDSLRDAAQVCSASLRIIGSISVNSTSRANVSSVDRWRVAGNPEVIHLAEKRAIRGSVTASVFLGTNHPLSRIHYWTCT
jgi:hypothetical protein